MLNDSKERYAFIFDEDFFTPQELKEIQKKEKNIKEEKNFKPISEYRSFDYEVYVDTLNKTNSMLDVVGSFVSIYEEHNKTKELKKQIKSKEKALDSLLYETARRADICLREEKERLYAEIEYMKKSLNDSLQKVKSEAEFSKYKLNLDYKERRQKNKIFENARKEILKSLDFTRNIIDNEDNIKNKYYLQMNDQYKECLRNYNNLIKNYVKGEI